MKPQVRIKGMRKLQRRIKRALKKNPQSVLDAMTEASSLVEASAKKNIVGTGRTRSIRMGRPVTAAKNVLANDQGTLRSSIAFKITSRGSNGRNIRLTSKIGPQRVRYGAIHEFGGRAGRGANIPARPYMEPALDKNEAAILRLLGKSFKLVR